MHYFKFASSSRSLLLQPLVNPMFLPQLCVSYNFAARSNLVRAVDHTVEMDLPVGAKSVHNCTFCPSLRSQLPQPLGNPMFLPQLLTGYNFAAGSNLVRGACRMLFDPGSLTPISD